MAFANDLRERGGIDDIEAYIDGSDDDRALWQLGDGRG